MQTLYLFELSANDKAHIRTLSDDQLQLQCEQLIQELNDDQPENIEEEDVDLSQKFIKITWLKALQQEINDRIAQTLYHYYESVIPLRTTLAYSSNN